MGILCMCTRIIVYARLQASYSLAQQRSCCSCLLLQAEANRVQQKPQYLELSGRGTEAEQAAEAIANARSWQDSVISDVVGGLLQSTVTCSKCHHQNYCFEPFLDLPVHIPVFKNVSLQVRSAAVMTCADRIVFV